MKLFEPLVLKFEEANWPRNPEFGLFDTILEEHPELYKIVEQDITAGQKDTNLGRGDTPSVEQIVRGAVYNNRDETSTLPRARQFFPCKNT
jgi:hypothetical protein